MTSRTTLNEHVGRLIEAYRHSSFAVTIRPDSAARSVIVMAGVVWEEYWPDPDEVELLP